MIKRYMHKKLFEKFSERLKFIQQTVPIGYILEDVYFEKPDDIIFKFDTDDLFYELTYRRQ